ncbi:hypothetical protein LCGC14_1230800 [marine sediment metagenome]|uniref:Uncharacterized protein n=1 Tax=marine sediment metagenome TaxID=412755 RepID=A0A0F9PCX0_9ZZZZ
MKCKKHPRYKGIREPRTECLDCWKIHEADLKKELIELDKEMDDIMEELERI